MPQERFTLTEHRHSEHVFTFSSECPHELGTNDMLRLRTRITSQQSTDRTQDEALITLRREITDLKLVVGELARLLVATGALPAEAVERLVRGVDRTSAP